MAKMSMFWVCTFVIGTLFAAPVRVTTHIINTETDNLPGQRPTYKRLACDNWLRSEAEAEAKAEADIQRQSALEDRHATFAWLPCAVKPAHKHGDDSYTRQT